MKRDELIAIGIAHPSWPWPDEGLSVCRYQPNVSSDLSGGSPKYFPPNLLQYANPQPNHRMRFGADCPRIAPERWIKNFNGAAFQPEVPPQLLRENAIRLPGLGTAGH